MDQALAVGLNGIPLAVQHGDKIKDPIKRKVQKARGQLPEDDPDVHDHRVMEDKGLVLRKRSEVRSDEEIVECVRHRGEVLPRKPRRPGNVRQASSMEDLQGDGSRYGRNGRYRRDAGGYGSDSEGSVPPNSRRSRARSTTSRSQRRRGSSTSSTSSSDLGDTSSEEKEMKKMQRKKWITAALASVATIHAASKVYSSIEAHDKRIQEVQAGTLSPEDAHKKARASRWQDAAAIGIAALGIKGAISEWNEVQEENIHHRELISKSQENHKRRLEKIRRQQARENGGYYKGHDGNWYYDGPELQHSERSLRGSSYSRTDSRSLDGPRQGERKLLEAPPTADYRDRARSAYGRDRDDDYDRVYDSSRRDRRATTFSNSRDSVVTDANTKHRRQVHKDVKDFGLDGVGEILEGFAM